MVNVQDVMDALEGPAGPQNHSVDGLCFGELLAEVTGIAVTFMATQAVLEQAVRAGANLIISHEGLFYSHHDVTNQEQNSVADAKRRFLEENALAVYRFHDGIHRSQPDGIMEGLVRALDWQAYVTEHRPEAALLTMPETSVDQVILHIKRKLSLQYVRAVGELSMNCSRIALLAGYRGGRDTAIPLFEKYHADLVIYGEGPEWETPEYTRDAQAMGKRQSLIVLGHAESEQPGMELAARRLSERFPMLPVHFIPVAPLFRVV